MNKTVLIDRQSPVPLREQVKRSLFSRITSGEWKPGELIASEQVLCDTYRLSRTTVRQAISDLVEKGVLRTLQGRGTFVTKSIIPLDLHRLRSFSEDMRARGKEPASVLIDYEMVPASEEVIAAFGRTEDVLKIRRLRFASGTLSGIHTSYLPQELSVARELLESQVSLYDVLSNEFDVILTWADEILEATVADRQDAELMGIEFGSPIMRIERVAYDQNGEPRELAIMKYRADEYKYYIRLKR